ncbi:MAG: hypothetical protein FJ125_15605, partial [Deltaproteobacteria bacterium]|nr:hypothetical protein [Deltaproteobacteria bacterium]
MGSTDRKQRPTQAIESEEGTCTSDALQAMQQVSSAVEVIITSTVDPSSRMAPVHPWPSPRP